MYIYHFIFFLHYINIQSHNVKLPYMK